MAHEGRRILLQRLAVKGSAIAAWSTPSSPGLTAVKTEAGGWEMDLGCCLLRW
jgi:hypothetical protein